MSLRYEEPRLVRERGPVDVRALVHREPLLHDAASAGIEGLPVARRDERRHALARELHHVLAARGTHREDAATHGQRAAAEALARLHADAATPEQGGFHRVVAPVAHSARAATGAATRAGTVWPPIAS